VVGQDQDPPPYSSPLQDISYPIIDLPELEENIPFSQNMNIPFSQNMNIPFPQTTNMNIPITQTMNMNHNSGTISNITDPSTSYPTNTPLKIKEEIVEQIRATIIEEPSFSTIIHLDDDDEDEDDDDDDEDDIDISSGVMEISSEQT